MSAGSRIDPSEIRRIGRWPVLGMVGQGGFSWIFLVENNLGQQRALKMLQPHASVGEGYKRFWREARILAAIEDEHLVRIFEFDRDPATGLDYYVMELLPGRDLAKLIAAVRRGQESAPPVEAVGELFIGALQGLAKLHAQRPAIVHRDVKPSNIQITEPGKAKILDLGIARVARQGDETVDPGSELTTFQGFMGTVKYASPEQLRGDELGPASDVFSLALCLFQGLEHGRHVYDDIGDLRTASSSAGVDFQRALAWYAKLDATGRELPIEFQSTPKALQTVIRKALRIQPGDRFADAGEMLEAVRRAVVGPSPAPSPKPGPRLPVGAAAAVLAIGLAAAGLLWWAPWEEHRRPPMAEVAPPTVVDPVHEASDEQLATKGEAEEMARRLEDEISRERLAETDLDFFQRRLTAGQTAWGERRFQDAATDFAAASSIGAQILTLLPTETPFERAVGALLGAQGSDPSGRARIWTTPEEVRIGSTYSLHFEVPCDCWALLFSVGVEGDSVDLLYPNPFEPAKLLAAGTSVRLPSSKRYILEAVPPAGEDTLKLLLTKQRIDFTPGDASWEARPDDPESMQAVERLLAEGKIYDTGQVSIHVLPREASR